MKKTSLVLSIILSLIVGRLWAPVMSTKEYPGGTNGNVQYNDNYSFGGESTFTYDENGNRLSISSMSAQFIDVSTISAFKFYGDGSNLTGIVGGSGGPQSSLAGSVATSPLNMNQYAITNASGVSVNGSSTSVIQTNSDIFKIQVAGGDYSFGPSSLTLNGTQLGTGGSGGPQSSLAGSIATGPLNMNNYAINNATNMAKLDGSSQTFNMGSGIFQINSRELYTRGTTIGFITGVTGQENQFLIKGSASNSNRTLALDRHLSLTGWSLQDYATTVPASYQDIYLNPLGGDIGIATTAAVVPLDVKGTVKSTLLSDYGIMDYWAFGDSITAGAQATNSTLRYPNIIATQMGYNLHNMGFSGAVLEETGIIDNVFATPVTSQTVSSILIGYNNSRYYAYDVARSTMFEASLNSALVYLALPDTDKYWTNHSSWNFTGTWVNKDSYGQTGKSKASSTPGDIAISTVNGKCLFLTVTSTASGGGKIFVTVDGSTVGNFNLAGALVTYGGTSARRSYAPMTIVIPNLLNGNHEIIVKVLSGYCEINWIAGLQHHAGTDGIGVYVGNALRMTDYQYAVASPAGTIHTNRLFNKAIEKVVKRLAREGLNVTLVDVESKFKPDGGMMDADNVHPNDYGHNTIANAFLAKMSKGSSGQEKQGGNFLAGYTPPFSFGLEKSSIGASGLFTFDTENTRLGISSATPATSLVIKSPGDSLIGALSVTDSADADRIGLDPNYGLIGDRSSLYVGNSLIGGQLGLRTSRASIYDTNAIWIDGGTGNVGIDTQTVASKLHVAARDSDAILTLENTAVGRTSGINFSRERSVIGNGLGGSIFMDSDPGTASAFLYLQAQSLSAGAGVRTPLSDYNGARIIIKGSSGTLAFETGSQERMNIDYVGNVAFGTRTAEGYVHIHSTSPESSKQISQLMVSTGSGRFARTFDLTQASATFRVPIYGDGSNLTGINASTGLSMLLASTYSYTSVSTLSVSFAESSNIMIVAVTSAVLPNVFGDFPTVSFRFNGDTGNNYSYATDVGISSFSLLTNAGSPPGTPPGTPYFKKDITITIKDNAVQGSKNFFVESIHSSDPLTYNRFFSNAGTYYSNNRITSVDMFISWAKNGGKLGANTDRPSYIEVYKMGGLSTSTNNGIDVFDEEVMTVRRAQGINFKGTGVSVAQDGSTATVTINNGGAGADITSTQTWTGSNMFFSSVAIVASSGSVIGKNTIFAISTDIVNYLRNEYFVSVSSIGSVYIGTSPFGGYPIDSVQGFNRANLNVYTDLNRGDTGILVKGETSNGIIQGLTIANTDTGASGNSRGRISFTRGNNSLVGHIQSHNDGKFVINAIQDKIYLQNANNNIMNVGSSVTVFSSLTASSMTALGTITALQFRGDGSALTGIVGGSGGDQSSFSGSVATGTINFNNNDLINGATAYFKTVYVSSGNLGSPSFAFVGSTMTGIYYDPSGGGTINFVKASLDAPVSVFSYDTSNLSMATGKNMSANSYKLQNNNTSRITGSNADSSVGISFEPKGSVPASAFTDITNRWGFYGATLPFYGAITISSAQRSPGMTYLTVSSAPNYSGVFYQLTDSSMNVRVPLFVSSVTINGNMSVTGKIVKRVVTVADATSITPNIDTSDWVYQSNTQAAGVLTINAPTGSPSDGQSLGIRIKNTNIQTYSFNGIYRDPTGIALPTATTGSGNTNYLGFIYNLPDNKWDLTGSK